jgi:hypothetical protein
MKLTGIALCLIAPLKESLLGKYQRAIETKQVRSVATKITAADLFLITLLSNMM